MESNKNIVEKETSNVIEKEKSSVVVIDFMAEWCGPCKMQDPIIEEMKKKFEGNVEFIKIDVDENGTLADKYNVRAVPTLIIEKDGNVFEKFVGVTRSNVLENKINEALK